MALSEGACGACGRGAIHQARGRAMPSRMTVVAAAQSAE